MKKNKKLKLIVRVNLLGININALEIKIICNFFNLKTKDRILFCLFNFYAF